MVGWETWDRPKRRPPANEGTRMTPRGIWWTRHVLRLKYVLLAVLILGLIMLAYLGRGLA